MARTGGGRNIRTARRALVRDDVCDNAAMRRAVIAASAAAAVLVVAGVVLAEGRYTDANGMTDFPTAALSAPAAEAGTVTAWFRSSGDGPIPFADAQRYIVVALVYVDGQEASPDNRQFPACRRGIARRTGSGRPERAILPAAQAAGCGALVAERLCPGASRPPTLSR